MNIWLETVQTFEAPKTQIWQLLQPTAWKEWWPSVEEVFGLEEAGFGVTGDGRSALRHSGRAATRGCRENLSRSLYPTPVTLSAVRQHPSPKFGSTYQLLWKTPYGYSLATRVQITEWVEGELMELHFCDGLEGFVRFALQGQGDVTELGVCWELGSREAWISPAEMERTLDGLSVALQG